MKILISHVYSSHNNGDAAILSAQIDALKDAFKNPYITVLSVDKIKPGYKFDGVPVFNALMYWAIAGSGGNAKKLIRACGMMGYTLLWAITFRITKTKLPLIKAWRQPMKLLLEADLQVGVGGGYLRAKKDHVSTVILMLLFHQIWLAKLLGKPVYLYAQSFGPYPTRIQRRIAKPSLKKVDLILVRETKSKELLTSLGIDNIRVVQVPDSAFMFKPKSNFDGRRALRLKNSSDTIVGVTVRAWLSGPEQASYEQAMAELIGHITQKGFKVAVVAQVTATRQNDDDRMVGARIKRLIKNNDDVIFLEERFSHYEIKAIFAQLDYLVGTRFHSVIFALTAGVPAIAIEYEHKTSGIMQDLGLEKWVLNIEDVTAKRLAALFDLLVKESPAYVRQLNKVVQEYVDKAYGASQLIKQAYEQSASAGDGSK